MSLPLVTVLVPARDEQSDIGECIEAIARQDHPCDRLEVIVIDGGSADDTAAVAWRSLGASRLARFDVISNPTATTPSNLNVGLAKARGDVVCRVDARSRIPSNYVTTCVVALNEHPKVVVVGGRQKALAPGEGSVERGIARALNNPFGMGLSRYRRGASSGEAETVYLGAFRTADLRRVGGWCERWTTNQDFELNRRMSQAGDIRFESGIEVGYVPRRTLGALWRQYHRFGRWKACYWLRSGDGPRPRQFVLVATPPLAALCLLGSLWMMSGLGCLVVGLGLVLGGIGFEAASAGPEGDYRSRFVSILASSLIAAGWWSGVVRGMVRWPR